MTKNVTGFAPTAEQKKVIDGMTKEDRQAFGKLTDKQKIATMALMGALEVAEKAEIAFASSDELADFPIIALGQYNLQKDCPIDLKFLGFEPMTSPKPKENWKEREAEDGTTYYEGSGFYVVETLGKVPFRFGIYSVPMLSNILDKVPTRESNIHIPRNPTVKIEYKGLVPKKVLDEKYGFTLKKGNEAHAVIVVVEEKHKWDRYFSGCCNLLSNPTPNLGQKNKAKGLKLAQQNWSDLERARGNANGIAQIDNQDQRTIAAQ